ncbi:MAG: hypothetical protein MUF51_01610 [Vicinamibacteria bacterium]|jgi:nitrogen-specific signal transduction histidine kinase|nr:hypothetical protein [Vicinamibacteria bacterium]
MKPVMILDDDCTVQLANQKARIFLGKTARQLTGRLAGQALSCLNADGPEGCGHSEHCSGCVFRRSVTHTHATGESLRDVIAYQEKITPNGIAKVWYRISTERVGQIVLVRLEDVGTERRA